MPHGPRRQSIVLRPVTLAIIFLVILSAATLGDSLPRSMGTIDRVDILRRANRSTVQIEARRLRGQTADRSSGAGVILSSDGTIVTAYHVVEGHDRIVVRGTNTVGHSASLVAFDEEFDIAILRIRPASALEPASVASAEMVKPGRAAIVIGNPLGQGQSALTGRLGSPRMVRWANHHAPLVSIHADVMPGNSGGGAFDLQTGELLGITVAKSATQEGTGYVVPADRIAEFVQERSAARELATSRAVRERLGVNLRPVQMRGGEFAEGLLVTHVEDSGHAAASGLQTGDVLLGLEKYRTKNFDEVLFVLLSAGHSGGRVSYLVARRQSLARGTLSLSTPRSLHDSLLASTELSPAAH